MNTQRQAGNAIVEFALVLPFLLLVTLGIVALGRYTYFGIVVNNAAHAGALYGAQPGGGAADDSAGMIAAAENDAAGNGVGSVSSPAPTATKYCMFWVSTTPNPSPNPTANPSCAQTNPPNYAIQYVSVTVTGKATSGLPHVPFLPSTITITRTAVQRVQQ